jgi:hypothetical protein
VCPRSEADAREAGHRRAHQTESDEGKMLVSEFQASTKPKGKFIRAADLAGGELTLKISKVGKAEFPRDGGGTDRKILIEFDGHDQGLLLNRTNSDAMVLLFGDDTAGWTGQTIRLTPARVSFKGTTVDTVRVNRPKPSHPFNDGVGI